MEHNGYYIRAILFDEKITLDEIATIAECPKSWVSQAIHNKRRHPHIRQIIADKLGIEVHALWADATPSETKEAA